MPSYEQAQSAIERGLAFLDTVVGADGGWPCLRSKNADCTGPSDVELNPCMAAFGVLALESCDHSRARAIQVRTRTFLVRRMEYPGVWRYWPRIPPDVDDTALCSLAVGPRILLLFCPNIKRILSNRDAEGRFLTWMMESDSPNFTPDICPVVNANAISYLGDRPETHGAQHYLETQIEAPGEVRLASRHYPDVMNFYHALARASQLAAPAFARMRSTLVERIVERRDDSGMFGDVLYSALALSALDMLGALPAEDMEETLTQLLAAQRPDGGWPGSVHYVASPPLVEQSRALAQGPLYWFFTEAIPTACCIEVLARFLRRRRQ